jgi:hypothetical protein
VALSRDVTSRELAGLSDGPNIEQITVRVLPDGRLSRAEAAKYLGRASKTLAVWKWQGTGPRWILIGGRVFYYRKDLDDYIRKNQQENKPDYAGVGSLALSFSTVSARAKLVKLRSEARTLCLI